MDWALPKHWKTSGCREDWKVPFIEINRVFTNCYKVFCNHQSTNKKWTRPRKKGRVFIRECTVSQCIPGRLIFRARIWSFSHCEPELRQAPPRCWLHSWGYWRQGTTLFFWTSNTNVKKKHTGSNNWASIHEETLKQKNNRKNSQSRETNLINE